MSLSFLLLLLSVFSLFCFENIEHALNATCETKKVLFTIEKLLVFNMRFTDCLCLSFVV